ncbi:MAG TPA: thiamine pyrophosphate-dependent enzyme [Alloacidobacterium sp.]|nr:thiamine pyrophosphate-dependent enzyme [Alloacidobacterium sp.]
MLRCRILDCHARSLGIVASWKGKEAAAVGAAIDLQPEDAIIIPSGAAMAGLLKGAPLRSILFQSPDHSISGKKKRKNDPNMGAVQAPVATGIAYARSAGSKESVTVAFLSENPESSESGRHALQFATARKLPIVYVYSGEPVGTAQMYSRAFPVIPVDGSDVVAVYRVAHECIVRARRGAGPSVIACSFAPMNGASARSQDPIRNMEKYLAAKGLFKIEQKQSIIRRFEQEIAAARKPQQRGARQTAQHLFVM